MLVSFKIGNYLSFRNEQNLSFEPDGLKELPDNLLSPLHYNTNDKLLKSVAVYGHNSYGKTNLLKGFTWFKDLVLKSFSDGQVKAEIPVEPFILNTAVIGEPTVCEVVFIVKQTKYRYKISVNKSEVVEEGLYYAESKIRENALFFRLGQEFRISKGWNREAANRAEQAVFFAKPHILFLSVLLSTDSIPKIDDVSRWFLSNIIIPDTYLEELSKAQIIYSNTEYRNLILKFIESADIGFTTIFDKVEGLSKTHSLEKGLVSMWFEREIKQFELYTNHPVYDSQYNVVNNIEFNLQKNESAGSLKYFIVVCLIAYAIKTSKIIWIDELDARFDSTLLEMLVKTFHRPEVNQTSQMIFTTHNTILLDDSLRRDQMIIVEKNKWGESSISRMHTADNPIRIGKAVEKEYRKGRLGGVSKKIKGNLGPSLFDNLEPPYEPNSD